MAILLKMKWRKKMKLKENKIQKYLAKTIAVILTAAMVIGSVMPTGSAAAKEKMPKLSKKSITVTVNTNKKVKVKNAKKVKKTKWSVKDKKIVKLSKKKSKSVVIKGKAEGSTTVTAKITLKDRKKPLKRRVKVTVTKDNGIKEPFATTPAMQDKTAGPTADNKITPEPTSVSEPTKKPEQTEAPTDNPEPSSSAVPTDAPDIDKPLSISLPLDCKLIKQRESWQLSAIDGDTDSAASGVKWSVTPKSNADINESGLLTVSADAPAKGEITVTASVVGDNSKTDSVTLTIVENATSIKENSVKINKPDDTHPQGLTYRSEEAYSTVADSERGLVTRFDSSKNFNSSNDILAWVDIDSSYAGKTVTISAWMKYELPKNHDASKIPNLILNEGWNYSNPAVKWNASADTWYLIQGTYKLPENDGSNYNGNKNKIYIARTHDKLDDGENLVYYIDNLEISCEKAVVEKVELSAEDNSDTIYPNDTLQFMTYVTGEGEVSQKVKYSIVGAPAGVSIDESGLLTTNDANVGTVITVRAVSVEDDTKYDEKTVTVIESNAIEVKASLDNIWSGLDAGYYKNLAYDKVNGSVSFDNSSEGVLLSGGGHIAWVGFLMSKDGKAIDVSDYDYLEIDAETPRYAGGTGKVSEIQIEVYQTADKGGLKGKAIEERTTLNDKRSIRRFPLKTLVAQGVNLSDIKAIAVSNTWTMEDITTKIYGFKFVKNQGEDYIPKTVPMTITGITKKGSVSDPGSCQIEKGDVYPLSISGTNKNDEIITDFACLWSSSDESVATVSKDGVVTGVKAGTAMITATANDNNALTASYSVTVNDSMANISGIELTSSKDTINPGGELIITADVTTTGPAFTDVIWSLKEEIEGVTIAPSGNSVKLFVSESVAKDTVITVRSVCAKNEKMSAEKTITVKTADEGQFDFNNLKLDYWEDFNDRTLDMDKLTAAGVISKPAPALDECWVNLPVHFDDFANSAGIFIMDDTLSLYKMKTRAMEGCFAGESDYLQFTINNTGNKEKDYTLSFMFRFSQIANDYFTKDMLSLADDYKLPIKLVSLDENNNEVTLQQKQIPFICNTSLTNNIEYHEILQTVTVQPGKTVRLQLKLDGELPHCYDSTAHKSEAEINGDAVNKPHPIVYNVDNVAISSNVNNTITMKKGSTYQLQLDTMDTDTVRYYTNVQSAQYTHNKRETTCTRYETIIAGVDTNGLITAYESGETALFAEITHQDGTVERKQCIVKVEE